MVPFWEPLGLHFGALGRPSCPKIGLGRPFFRKHAIFQILHATRGRVHSVTSRGHRKRPKIAPRRSQDGLDEVLFRCSILSSILVRFWSDFGSLLGPQMGHFGGRFLAFFRTSPQWRPKSAPRGAKRLQKGAPGGPKRRPRGLKSAQKGAQEAPRGPKRPQEEPKGKRKREEIGPKRLSEHHLLKNVHFHEACAKPMKFDNFKVKGNERTRAE